jgi:hypothetical protein
MIVGESLFSVVFAFIVYLTGNGDPIAIVGEGFVTYALIAGTLLFFALLAFLYRRAAAMAGSETS